MCYISVKYEKKSNKILFIRFFYVYLHRNEIERKRYNEKIIISINQKKNSELWENVL